MNGKLYPTIIGAVVFVFLAAMSTWMFKVDARQFDMQVSSVSRIELRQEFSDFERRIDKRFDNLETLMQTLLKEKRSVN